MNASELKKAVADDRDEMVQSLCDMLRIVAVGPESKGPGEAERGKYLVALAKRLGFKSIEVFESHDPSVPTGRRPNVIVRLDGVGKKRLWVISHMDTVPEGDADAWKNPPFEPKVVSGKIYGRGAEDNGQELIASLYGLRALLRCGIAPEFNVGLVFVADEEHGNTHGIDFLISKGLFRKGDLVVVPDHGDPDGSAIEVVEKSLAWVKVEVIGKQTHASTPAHGINAFEVAARYMIAVVDRLRSKYKATDELFDPPVSTFAPTSCEANGLNVNTIPGRQVFSFDFRVLPRHKIRVIMADMRAIADGLEKKTGAKIKLSYIQKAVAAPKTSVDSEVVVRLSAAIMAVKGVKPRPVGIGGGTCAAPFRRMGIDAAVWSTAPGNAHDANEYARIRDPVSDAQVYAVLFAGKNLGRV